MKKTNPFSIFGSTEKTAFIEALNAEITYRELTMHEADVYNMRYVKEYKAGGEKPVIDMEEVTETSYEKIAKCLLDPAMTVDELKALPASASKALNQIGKLIDGKDIEEDELDEEGNSES